MELKLDGKTLLAFVIIGAVLVLMFRPPTQSINPWPSPSPTTQPTTPTHEASQLQFTGIDYVTRGSITSVDVDVFKVSSTGTVAFLTDKMENIAANSAPEQGVLYYNEGDTLILHIEDDADPSGGEDYYDGWYVATLRVGETVYNLDFSCLQMISSRPYVYKLIGRGPATNQRVAYTSGTTKYWDVGQLAIIPRTDDASLDQYLVWSGTTMAKMENGTTEVDTQAEQTSDVTWTTDDEDLKYVINVDTTNLAYGAPVYWISSNGEFQYAPTIMFVSTNMTSIGVSHFTEQGWEPVALSTLTAEKMFMKIITPAEYPTLIPSQGGKSTATIIIPVDASAATGSTAYCFKIWLNDGQIVGNSRLGAPSVSIPTSYGVSGYGLAGINNDETVTVSSGAGATETLYGDVTLPA